MSDTNKGNKVKLAFLLTTTMLAIFLTSSYAFGLLSKQEAGAEERSITLCMDTQGFYNISSIDWGPINTGDNKSYTAYISNGGNSSFILTMEVSNWNPVDVSNYMTVNWDYMGQVIKPNETIKVVFTIVISSGIDEIQPFTFDIILLSYTR
jgi:hypothetical protein